MHFKFLPVWTITKYKFIQTSKCALFLPLLSQTLLKRPPSCQLYHLLYTSAIMMLVCGLWILDKYSFRMRQKHSVEGPEGHQSHSPYLNTHRECKHCRQVLFSPCRDKRLCFHLPIYHCPLECFPCVRKMAPDIDFLLE